MIKSARQIILTRFEADIRNAFKTSQGYELNCKEFRKGFNPIASKNYPFISFEIGQGQRVPKSDSMFEMYEYTLLLALHYSITADQNKQGELVEKSEQALSDFTKFVHQDRSIEKQYTLQLDKCSNGKNIGAITWYATADSPVPDAMQTSAICSVIITVKYTSYMGNDLTENLQQG